MFNSLRYWAISVETGHDGDGTDPFKMEAILRKKRTFWEIQKQKIKCHNYCASCLRKNPYNYKKIIFCIVKLTTSPDSNLNMN